MHKQITYPLALAALTLGSMADANAAVITYTATTGASEIALKSFPGTIAIDKFDTSLGTLDSAVLTLAFSATGKATAVNSSGDTATLTSLSSNVSMNVSLTNPVSLSLRRSQRLSPLFPAGQLRFRTVPAIAPQG
jgi:hypothetical protein